MKEHEIISRNLLQEILESKSKITRYELEENELLFYLMSENGVEFGRTINVYELMSMAKEWALEPVKGRTGYIIHIEPIMTIDNGIIYVGHGEDMSCFTIFDGDNETFTPVYTTDETLNKRYKATFQVCQWIYDKVKSEISPKGEDSE